MSRTPPPAASHESRAQNVRRVRVDVQRARAAADSRIDAATTQPWAVPRDVAVTDRTRFFPGNEPGDGAAATTAAGGGWQTDNSVSHSIVRASVASSLIRETMVAPTIDAWPRRQNKLSSLAQKPSDADSVPPLMRQLNKLVWEGLRSIGVIVDRCVAEYRKQGPDVASTRGRAKLMHDVTEIFDPAALGGEEGAAFSQLTAARLATEVVHRFLDKTLLAEHTASSDPQELRQNVDEIVSDNRHAEQVAHDLGAAVARWSIFEQAGAVFSKCFATYETAISEVMKECADCVDEVLNVLVSEIVSLRGRVAAARAQHREHEHAMAAVRAERDAAQRECAAAKEAAHEALLKLAQRDKENKRLGYELEDREKQIARQHDEMDLLSKQYNVQETRISKLSKSLAAAREEIDSLTMRNADLKRSLAQSESVSTTCAVETLQLRQQLATVSSLFQQLRAEGRVGAGEPKPEFIAGKNASSPSASQLMGRSTITKQPSSSLGHTNSMSNAAGSMRRASMSAALFGNQQQQQPGVVLDINDWLLAATEAYVAEVDARCANEYQGTAAGGENESAHAAAAGAFVHWRTALERGLKRIASASSAVLSASPSAVSSQSIASLHFPELKQRNGTAVAVVHIADEAARPFFVGMGTAPSVPSALRYVGKIPNMRFGPETIANMIIAFFRDTAENTPKNVLMATLDPVHQFGVAGHGAMTRAEYNKNVRRTLADDRKSLNPPGTAASAAAADAAGGDHDRRKSTVAMSASSSVREPALHVVDDTKTLLQMLSHWLTIHLDCNDDATPTVYNMIYAARWHSYAPVCRFFDAALRFDAPAALWFAIADTIELFKVTLENSVQDVFSVGEASVQEAVKKTFASSLTNAAVTRISVVVHGFFQDAIAAAEAHAQNALAVGLGGGGGAAATAPSFAGAGRTEITLRSIFVSGVEFAKRKHRRMLLARQTKETTTCNAIWAADSVDESCIVASIRNECILAWYDLMAELTESIMDRGIVSPEGHVTPYSVANALLVVDPLRPRASTDKIIAVIFGPEKQRTPAEELEWQQQQQKEQEEYEARRRLASDPAFLAEADAVAAATAAAATAATAAGTTETNTNAAGSDASASADGAAASARAEAGGSPTAVVEEQPPKKKKMKGPFDDDEEILPGTNYAERYRNRVYAGGDMVLVQEALARIRMVPVARFTPPADNLASNDD